MAVNESATVAAVVESVNESATVAAAVDKLVNE